MLGRLLPRENSFFDLFEKHAKLTVDGTREFAALARSSDASAISLRARRVAEIEHETDVITHQCVEMLHKTFITPIDRDAIHRLISRMDDVMDFVEAAAERVVLYEVTVMTPEVQRLADILVQSAVEVEIAVRGLRDLQKNQADILQKCIDINRLENDADQILREAVARLFREGKADPLHVMKWKEIYENLESATDRCEDVANTIEGVVLEHS